MHRYKTKTQNLAHICGSDLIRNHQGEFQALEDNLRVPRVRLHD